MRTLAKQVDGLFSRWDNRRSPGCALGVIRDGRFIHKRCYGMANLEHGIPITADSVFDVGSVSKQFVAACVAILARRRRLSLEDEVRKHVPEMPRYRYPVRIRHLLHHTSGIRDYLTLMDLAGLSIQNEFPDDEILGLIARQKDLNFRPGSQFMYSNSGYLLLGEIVKRVSGKSLRVFAHENIFAPLGMKNSHFHDDLSEIVPNRAAGYTADDKGPKISVSILDLVGDGGLNTTLNDLRIWDDNFYRNRVGGFGGALIKDLATPGRLNDGSELNYGQGVFVEKYRGLRAIHHGGSWLGYKAEMIRFPEQRLTVICLANNETLSAVPLARQTADIFLDKAFPERSCPVPKADFSGQPRTLPVSGRTGFYQAQKTGTITRLVSGRGYHLEYFGRKIPLKRISAKSLQAQSGEMLIEFTGPQEYTLSLRNGDKTPYRWLPPVRLGKSQAARLTGDYYCAELDVTYRITSSGKALRLKRKCANAEDLLPVAPGFFQSDISIKLRFDKSGPGRPKYFLLNTNRVSGLKFERRA